MVIIMVPILGCAAQDTHQYLRINQNVKNAAPKTQWHVKRWAIYQNGL